MTAILHVLGGLVGGMLIGLPLLAATYAVMFLPQQVLWRTPRLAVAVEAMGYLALFIIFALIKTWLD